MTTAGSPCLERHVPRSEDRARIEAALFVAREARAWARLNALPAEAWPLKNALQQIIALLDAGDTQAQQDLAESEKAKPQKEIV